MTEHGTLLDDERAARMRQGVLHEIDADVERRGRRGRRLRAGVGAACAVVVLGGVGSTLLQPTGGSSASDSASAGSSAEVAPAPEGGDSSSLSTDSRAPGAGTRAEVGRQVVTTGSATVRVDDPARAADRLAAWVVDDGGRVDQRSELEAEDGGLASATMTLRVPATTVDRTVAELRRTGTVVSLDVGRDDVTTEVADLDARIRSLTSSVERLREILAEADDATDLLAVEKSLSDRQAELESLQAQRRVVGEQVSLATLSVELVARDAAEGVDPGGFGGGLVSGWNALVAVADTLVTWLGALLPWAGLLGAAWLLWALGRRLPRRRLRPVRTR